MQRGIPCMIFRGGTSKGLYLLEKDLPPPGDERDAVLLRLMGSPDARQIDGLGGAVSVTSKVAILGPSERDDADINYTFAQVSVDKPVVSYAGNCGNISSGVGPFAIESGLVKPKSPTTLVRIYNTNTKKILIEDIQTPDRQVNYEGDCEIPGVPGSAAPIKVLVLDPAGSVCGKLLPTGNARDKLDIPGFGSLSVSIVDAANPLVFALAGELGLSGKELPGEMDSNPELLDLLERIRGKAAQVLGLIEKPEDSPWKSPGVPKMTLVAPPAEYTTLSGNLISEDKIDLLGRMMSMQKTHPTYAMTGAMCTAAAALIPGSIVHGIKRPSADPARLRIAHPGGILEAGVDYTESAGIVSVQSVYGYRTARLLAKGTAYY
ncbi:2-methylaconitate cis-trans isomerase PrpF family protein [Treponema primitia]|nr:PrpF domain-containing protein [Treponema primitia]